MTNVATAYAQADLDRMRMAKDCYDAGDIPAASVAIEEILKKDPNDAQALTIASMILKKAGRLPFAYSLAQRAVEIAPWHPETHAVRGLMAQNLWRMDEATSAYKMALQKAKTPAQRALYLNNLASIHLDNGEFARGMPLIEESLKLDPDERMARHNYGLCLLAERRWREGWEYYSASIGSENRLNIKYTGEPGEPKWDGTKGKTVVIYGEQGLGDEICAASMLPDAIRDCGRVIVDCDRRLKGLFTRSFPNATVHGTRWEKGLPWPVEDQAIDYSIAGFEIGQFYRQDQAAFTGEPYLKSCPERTAMWRALFASRSKPTIGVAWSGGTWQNASLYRNLPLSQWKPIFDAVDANWISLQYKDATKEIEGTPVQQYPWATLTKDYDDTAALVAACDLVIGMQTTVCHLAGALGKPVLTMIPKTSQWRYGETYTDVPWYRSMKLYRQKSSWEPVVKQIAEDLHAYL